MLEKERDSFNEKLAGLYTTIGQIRSELALGGRLLREKCLDTPIVVPPELRHTRKGDQKQKGNRAYHMVQKRWDLWKEQLKTGISANALAKAWGCDHTTILFAQRQNFTAKKAWSRKK
jgi:hypothetical protein